MNNVERFFVQDPAAFARSYIDYVSQVFKRIDSSEIARFIEALLDARARSVSIFFIGNGGSAATASHFANDLAVGTQSYAKPFRAISLADNQAIVTAVANDFGFEDVFVRQLRILAKPGDLVVAISASGNSPNLVSAFEYAQSAGIKRIAITGFDGGKIRQMADLGVHVPTEPKEYGPAEDAHMMLDHLVGAYLMQLVKSDALA
jgi:D-sedoheptulose 7-phosphate isomerase